MVACGRCSRGPFYKGRCRVEANATNAFYLVSNGHQLQQPSRDFIFKRFINRCTQPDVHPVTCSLVYNFWSFASINVISKPPVTLTITFLHHQSVVSRSGEASFTSRFDNAFFHATNTNTHEGILFSITVFTSAKSRLTNQDLWSSQWSLEHLTKNVICFTQSFKKRCLLFNFKQVVIRNNQQCIYYVREVRSLHSEVATFWTFKPEWASDNGYCQKHLQPWHEWWLAAAPVPDPPPIPAVMKNHVCTAKFC